MPPGRADLKFLVLRHDLSTVECEPRDAEATGYEQRAHPARAHLSKERRRHVLETG